MKAFAFQRSALIGLIASTGVAGALAIAGVARAGEMQESGQYVNLTPKVSCSKVGDVEGHVVCSFESQGVLIAGNGAIGKRVVRGTIDYTNGVGKNQGHSVTMFGDGSTRTSAWQGMAKRDADNNRYSEGTYTCVGGSGRFEGIKCDGKWRTEYQKAKFSIGKYEGVATLPE
jgi:hypothetical protein